MNYLITIITAAAIICALMLAIDLHTQRQDAKKRRCADALQKARQDFWNHFYK